MRAHGCAAACGNSLNSRDCTTQCPETFCILHNQILELEVFFSGTRGDRASRQHQLAFNRGHHNARQKSNACQLLAAGPEANMFVLANDVLNGVALMTANNVLALRQSNCEYLMTL
jgi:hypothetical protein